MREEEDIMRVTIHAAYLQKDSTEAPLSTQLLQKVVHTIEQFESRGWQAELVDQDDIAATITFRRGQQGDVSESSSG
jgi:hypothetical protein